MMGRYISKKSEFTEKAYNYLQSTRFIYFLKSLYRENILENSSDSHCQK